MNAALPLSKATTAYDLLSEIAALALEEPKRIRMGTYFDYKEFEDDRPTIGVKAWPACGTVGCIAGWVTILLRLRNGLGITGELAREALGITEDDAISLFHNDRLVNASDRVQGTKAHAAQVAAHIRAFQQKHEAQLRAQRVP